MCDQIISLFEVYPGCIQICFSPFVVVDNYLIDQKLLFCYSRYASTNFLLISQKDLYSLDLMVLYLESDKEVLILDRNGDNGKI